MQFKVPQFLEIEDKIFGPFTFKQFVYLVGGAGLCYVLYQLLGIWLGAIPIILIAGLSLSLTFYRPNGKPFIEMLEAGFRFLVQSRLYIWKEHSDKKIANKNAEPEKAKEETMTRSGVRLSGEKLKDLAWSLDVLDSKNRNI